MRGMKVNYKSAGGRGYDCSDGKVRRRCHVNNVTVWRCRLTVTAKTQEAGECEALTPAPRHRQSWRFCGGHRGSARPRDQAFSSLFAHIQAQNRQRCPGLQHQITSGRICETAAGASAEARKCKLLMLPGGGELNWRELKEVHDCWRSEGHRDGSTGISMFITASAKLLQICTCRSRRHRNQHTSKRSTSGRQIESVHTDKASVQNHHLLQGPGNRLAVWYVAHQPTLASPSEKQ